MPRPLSERELLDALADLPGWQGSPRALSCTLRFADFAEAFSFMARVAAEAERLDHHPDWRNVWNLVEIRLSTHDAGDRVTDRDVALAREIVRIAGPRLGA